MTILFVFVFSSNVSFAVQSQNHQTSVYNCIIDSQLTHFLKYPTIYLIALLRTLRRVLRSCRFLSSRCMTLCSHVVPLLATNALAKRGTESAEPCATFAIVLTVQILWIQPRMRSNQTSSRKS